MILGQNTFSHSASGHFSGPNYTRNQAPSGVKKDNAIEGDVTPKSNPETIIEAEIETQIRDHVIVEKARFTKLRSTLLMAFHPDTSPLFRNPNQTGEQSELQQESKQKAAKVLHWIKENTSHSPSISKVLAEAKEIYEKFERGMDPEECIHTLYSLLITPARPAAENNSATYDSSLRQNSKRNRERLSNFTGHFRIVVAQLYSFVNEYKGEHFVGNITYLSKILTDFSPVGPVDDEVLDEINQLTWNIKLKLIMFRNQSLDARIERKTMFAIQYDLQELTKKLYYETDCLPSSGHVELMLRNFEVNNDFVASSMLS